MGQFIQWVRHWYVPPLVRGAVSRTPDGGRIAALDHAKGLGILVVVFVHTWRGLQGAGLLSGIESGTYWAVSAISTMICIPAFFFASGYVYGWGAGRRSGASELAGKVDGILYPFLIWSLIIGVVAWVTSGIRNGTSNLEKVYVSLIWPLDIFWFLAALFLSFLACEAVAGMFGRQWLRRLVLPIAGVALLTWQSDVLPFAFREFQLSFVFFAAGVCVQSCVPLRDQPSWGHSLLALAAMVAGVTWVSMNDDWLTSSIRSVTPNATPAAFGLLGVLTLFCVACPASASAWLKRLGQRSMDIYLLHLIFTAGCRILLQKGFGLENALLIGVTCMVAGICAPLFLARWMKAGPLKVLFSPPAWLSARRWLRPV